MNYDNLHDEVVAKLAPFVDAGITVERLPQTEADKKTVLPTKARFTVIVAGSEYGPPNSTAQVVQEEKVFIQILIETTFLYGPLGVGNLTSVLKKMLTGFRPQGLKKLTVSKHHMIGQPEAEKKNNLWKYQVIFQGDNLHVEDFTEDLTPLLKQIKFFDVPGGEETIIPNPDNVTT